MKKCSDPSCTISDQLYWRPFDTELFCWKCGKELSPVIVRFCPDCNRAPSAVDIFCPFHGKPIQERPT